MDFCVIVAQNKIQTILYCSYKCFDNQHSNAAATRTKMQKYAIAALFWHNEYEWTACSYRENMGLLYSRVLLQPQQDRKTAQCLIL